MSTLLQLIPRLTLVRLAVLLAAMAVAMAQAAELRPTAAQNMIVQQWEQKVALAQRDQAQVVPVVIEAATVVLSTEDAVAFAVADAVQPLLRQLYGSGDIIPHMGQLGLSVHTVASGESPGAILRQYGMTNDQLVLLNPHYDDRRLGPGQQLKVFALGSKKIALAVNKHAFRAVLIASENGQQPQLIWTAPCGLGIAGRDTPVGVTTVSNKVRDPSWTHPDTKEVYAANDPRNVLGGYWIALNAGPDDRFRSIGLHGYTGAPSSDWLEQPGSRGCVRLLQADIEAIYAWLPLGSMVLITGEQ